MIDKLKQIGYNKGTKSIKGNTPKEFEMTKEGIEMAQAIEYERILRVKEIKMTRKELIEMLEQVKDKIAQNNELTEYARYRAYISVEDAIQQLIENYDGY